MTTDAPEPLWQMVVGDKEPWRRGRLFLIVFAIFCALSDLFLCGVLLLGGYINALLLFAVFRCVFWLQYYFIWIGVHWVRWLQGGLSMVYGLAFFVWSLENQSGPLMLWGMFCIATGAYLGFAPSVYFFAIRQRENRHWFYAIAVAVVFVLLLLSLASATLGLFRYHAYLQEQAREFADTAFQHIFAEHDTYFLLDRASAQALALPNGRFRLTKFLQDATIRAGDVRDIQKANGEIVLHYGFPAEFSAEGEMRAEGIGSRGRILMLFRLGGEPGDWKIDRVGWVFPDTVQKRPPR